MTQTIAKPEPHALSSALKTDSHIMLANIRMRRSDYLGALSELDNYLRLKPVGPQSDVVRTAEESLKQKLAGSDVIADAARTKP